MGAILDHTSSRARIVEPVVPVAVALLLLVLAIGETSSGQGLGLVAAGVWIAVALVALLRPERLGKLPSPLLIAAGLLVALTVLTAFSLGWGQDDGAAFEEAVRVASYAGLFVLAGLLAGRPGSGRGVLVGVLAGLVGVAVVALGSRLLGIGEGDAALADQLPTARGRLSFPIGYWNGLGSMMAMSVPLLVHFAATSEGPSRRLALAGFAPVLLTAYMTSSRGALLAALLGAAIVVLRARHRGLAAASLAVGIAGSVPAIAAAVLGSGLLDTPGDGTPGGPELAALFAVVAGAAALAALGPLLSTRLARVPLPRVRLRRPAAVAGAVVAVVALIVLAGPSRLVDDFRSFPDEARTDQASGILSASGSGRAQFWEAALSGWAESPVHGLGAGGFAAHWNRTNDVGTPTRNAHSEPLEQLAELGLLGFACFAGLIAVVLIAALRAARDPGVARDGVAALAILAVGGVGYLIDWTWSIPAVAVPVLIVGASVSAGAFGGVAPRSRSAPALAFGAVALAVPLVWAGAVLAVGSARLDDSRRQLADGSPAAAARSAREAIAIQPWAAEPWLQLAAVERSVDNSEAAARAAREAIERAPEDFRAWLLASAIATPNGRPVAGLKYAIRAYELAPNLLLRLREFAPELSPG